MVGFHFQFIYLFICITQLARDMLKVQQSMGRDIFNPGCAVTTVRITPKGYITFQTIRIPNECSVSMLCAIHTYLSGHNLCSPICQVLLHSHWNWFIWFSWWCSSPFPGCGRKQKSLYENVVKGHIVFLAQFKAGNTRIPTGSLLVCLKFPLQRQLDKHYSWHKLLNFEWYT